MRVKEPQTRLKPQVVLTDFTMPAMNGVEFGKEVRGLDPEAVLHLMTAERFRVLDLYREDVNSLFGGRVYDKPIPDLDRLMETLAGSREVVTERRSGLVVSSGRFVHAGTR